MAFGTRDFTVRASGTTTKSLMIGLVIWILFAALLVWIWHNSWIDPEPDDSARTIARGRMATVLGIFPVLAGALLFASMAGWLPILWIRHYADGSVAVRTVQGKLGRAAKTFRTSDVNQLAVEIVTEPGLYKFSLTTRSFLFSDGERTMRSFTYAPFDEQELRAKLDDTYQPPAREPY